MTDVDPLHESATRICCRHISEGMRCPSILDLQRELGIGYARASRLVTLITGKLSGADAA